MLRVDRDHKSAGQSLVELAMVLPLAVFVLFLAADFGRALTTYIQLGSAAREGAVYGMQSNERAADEDGIRQAVLAESGLLWGSEPDVTSDDSCTDGMQRPTGGEYQCVIVTVDYSFEPLFSIWPVPDTIPMQRSVRMRVVN